MVALDVKMGRLLSRIGLVEVFGCGGAGLGLVLELGELVVVLGLWWWLLVWLVVLWLLLKMVVLLLLLLLRDHLGVDIVNHISNIMWWLWEWLLLLE